MKFLDLILKQTRKSGEEVCGDYFLSERVHGAQIYILCDGIGSGVYANVSAIYSANRLIELIRNDVSLQDGCRILAESMHRARTEDVPFAAFSVFRVLPDGNFVGYSYEAPRPLIIQEGRARVMAAQQYQAGEEVFNEYAGILFQGDQIILYSDGVTQAGMGKGIRFGIGEEKIAEYFTTMLSVAEDRESHQGWEDIMDDLMAYVQALCDGEDEDDVTAAAIHCREGKSMVIATGPPSVKEKDELMAKRFASFKGTKAICGSSTIDILSNLLDLKVQKSTAPPSLLYPPEYEVEGVDFASEGAIMLNQTLNLLPDDPAEFYLGSPVELLCTYLHEHDCITFLLGTAINRSYPEMMFRQLGMHPRFAVVELLAEELEKMGKWVTIERY